MSDTKFTPEPWVTARYGYDENDCAIWEQVTADYRGEGYSNNIYIVPANHIGKCCYDYPAIAGNDEYHTLGETWAINLIAAAPDMYKEIDRLSEILGRLVMDIMQEHTHNFTMTAQDLPLEWGVKGEPRVKYSSELLAKARGETDNGR